MQTLAMLLGSLGSRIGRNPRASLILAMGLGLMYSCAAGYTWLAPRTAGALGTAITFVAAVPVFFSHDGKSVGYLLLERDELSLGKTQLFLWLIPSVAIYMTESLMQMTLIDFPMALAPLLGGSIGTTALSLATSPSTTAVIHADQTASATPSAPPSPAPASPAAPALAQVAASTEAHAAAPKGHTDWSLTSLIEDWRGQGDITRYQFLFLTLCGSVVLLASYIIKDEIPTEVPNGLLTLLGASAAGFVGTKMVKTVSMENEARSNPNKAA